MSCGILTLWNPDTGYFTSLTASQFFIAFMYDAFHRITIYPIRRFANIQFKYETGIRQYLFIYRE